MAGMNSKPRLHPSGSVSSNWNIPFYKNKRRYFHENSRQNNLLPLSKLRNRVPSKDHFNRDDLQMTRYKGNDENKSLPRATPIFAEKVFYARKMYEETENYETITETVIDQERQTRKQRVISKDEEIAALKKELSRTQMLSPECSNCQLLCDKEQELIQKLDLAENVIMNLLLHTKENPTPVLIVVSPPTEETQVRDDTESLINRYLRALRNIQQLQSEIRELRKQNNKLSYSIIGAQIAKDYFRQLAMDLGATHLPPKGQTEVPRYDFPIIDHLMKENYCYSGRYSERMVLDVSPEIVDILRKTRAEYQQKLSTTEISPKYCPDGMKIFACTQLSNSLCGLLYPYRGENKQLGNYTNEETRPKDSVKDNPKTDEGICTSESENRANRSSLLPRGNTSVELKINGAGKKVAADAVVTICRDTPTSVASKRDSKCPNNGRRNANKRKQTRRYEEYYEYVYSDYHNSYYEGQYYNYDEMSYTYECSDYGDNRSPTYNQKYTRECEYRQSPAYDNRRKSEKQNARRNCSAVEFDAFDPGWNNGGRRINVETKAQKPSVHGRSEVCWSDSEQCSRANRCITQTSTERRQWGKECTKIYSNKSYQRQTDQLKTKKQRPTIPKKITSDKKYMVNIGLKQIKDKNKPKNRHNNNNNCQKEETENVPRTLCKTESDCIGPKDESNNYNKRTISSINTRHLKKTNSCRHLNHKNSEIHYENTSNVTDRMKQKRKRGRKVLENKISKQVDNCNQGGEHMRPVGFMSTTLERKSEVPINTVNDNTNYDSTIEKIETKVVKDVTKCMSAKTPAGKARSETNTKADARSRKSETKIRQCKTTKAEGRTKNIPPNSLNSASKPYTSKIKKDKEIAYTRQRVMQQKPNRSNGKGCAVQN